MVWPGRRRRAGGSHLKSWGAFAVIMLLRRLAVVFAILLAAPSAAQAEHFLPKTPTDLTAAEKAVVARPGPVQLIFQFRTKGSFNPHATQWLGPMVLEHVRNSGAFSEVTTGPAPGGAVLTITLENIPEEGAFRQGFATGATFGLAGNTVIDYYICTVEFSPGPEAGVVTKEVRHQIITNKGIKKQPVDTIRTETTEEAVLTMTRHVVTNGVNDIAKDPGFVLASAAPAAPRTGAAARFGSIAAVRDLTATGLPPIKLGTFAVGKGLSAGDDKTMMIRLVKVQAFGGSFSGYMRAAVESQLARAGKLDPNSGLELTGFLLKREVHSNDPADGTVSARFVLKRDGVVVYEKTHTATDQWKSTFAAAEAVPDAIYRFYTLYDAMAQSLLLDPEFVAAAKGG
ncbi:MAG: hypothetical protein K0R83_282 [Caulobacter sp.]|nr:hypothetical protein [Caulobacter sp.]